LKHASLLVVKIDVILMMNMSSCRDAVLKTAKLFCIGWGTPTEHGSERQIFNKNARTKPTSVIVLKL
jgi:hypothetical protein